MGTANPCSARTTGWTYGLDGSFRAAPGLAKESGLDTEQLGLWPVQVDTWGPLVFVNPDP